MLILTALVVPITYYTNKKFSLLVQAAAVKEGAREGNIIDAVEEHLGRKWAKSLTLMYFVHVFPVMMIYTITLTNTIIDFCTSQLHIEAPSRFIVAPAVVAALVALVQFNPQAIVKMMSVMVFPFIISLFAFGFMAIPHWNTSFFTTASDFGGASGLFSATWSALPTAIYAFSFASIISSFVVAQKREYGSNAPRKCDQILAVAVALIIFTVVFFSWSVIFALTPEDFLAAKENNLTALSYLAKKFDNPMLAYASQIIVFFATVKSFFAHFLATQESAKGFVTSWLGGTVAATKGKLFRVCLATFIFVATLIPALLNWNVLNLIKVAIVPISVFVVYFLPQVAYRKSAPLNKYIGGFSNKFVVCIGIICLVNGLLTAL